MSNGEISRVLKINSPQEFYNILKKSNNQNPQLIPFMDRIELFLYGCPCEGETNWNQSVSEYKKLSNLDLSYLKDVIGCQSINFYLDGTMLFEV